MDTRRFISSCICALIVGAAATRVAAQRADGPYSGVLGGSADQTRTQGLDLHGSIFGSWDENRVPLFGDATIALDRRLQNDGASTGLSGSLVYDSRGDRAHFSLTGGGNARRYASARDVLSDYQAGTGLTADLGSRLRLTTGANAAYSQFYQFAPFLESGFGSGLPIGGLAYAVFADRNVTVDGSVGATEKLTKQTSLFVNATGREWRLLDDVQNGLRTWGVHGGLRHQLRRSVGLHIGYGRDENDYADRSLGRYLNETIDVGVDVGDSLAFARRVSLMVSTSTQVLRYRGETHFRANGTARLTRGFGRSWSSWIGYNRNTEFRVGFRAPLLTDSLNAGISGLTAWRLKWSADAGYTHGTIGFDANRFTSYTGTTQVDFALTRTLALFGQYRYYYFDVPAGSSVWNLAPRISRQVATVGLRVWAPLINDLRSPKEPTHR